MRISPLVILLIAIIVSGCTSIVPRKDLPYPLTGSDNADQVKVVTIPLPVIASSPNEGITYGGLTAFLLHNGADEVNAIVAPQVNYNTNFGVTSSIYGSFYPSSGRNWEINLSQSTKINNDYELKLRDRTLFGGKVEGTFFGYRFADGSARFFGFQSNSSIKDETNYSDRETGFTLTAGYGFGNNLQLVLGERFRDVGIGHGAVTAVPYIGSKFTGTQVPGLTGFTTHAQKISLIYSSLDSPDMPTTGYYGRASIEASTGALGSTGDYRHYEAEVKAFMPLEEARFVTVGRLSYNQTLGGTVPFLERSILGGETTLRGYGRNRFVDSSYFLCNIEERIRLFRWEIFHVNADWELAPFIDLGAVMEVLDKAKPSAFVFNPGVGLRAVVRPNIVGRIDIGFGNEGPAVFVGLGYPF